MVLGWEGCIPSKDGQGWMMDGKLLQRFQCMLLQRFQCKLKMIRRKYLRESESGRYWIGWRWQKQMSWGCLWWLRNVSDFLRQCQEIVLLSREKSWMFFAQVKVTSWLLYWTNTSRPLMESSLWIKGIVLSAEEVRIMRGTLWVLSLLTDGRWLMKREEE